MSVRDEFERWRFVLKVEARVKDAGCYGVGVLGGVGRFEDIADEQEREGLQYGPRLSTRFLEFVFGQNDRAHGRRAEKKPCRDERGSRDGRERAGHD